MGSFRTSTLPDWNLYERDGYFSSRTPRVSEAPSSQPQDKVPNVSATQLKYNFISKDVKQAEFQVKLSRLANSMWLACGWQMILFAFFSLLFIQPNNSTKTESSLLLYYFGITYLSSVSQTFVFSLISLSTLLLGVLVYFQLFMVATCLTSSEKYAESIKDQVSRYTTFRFLLKPLCFGAAAWAQCFIFVHLFDQSYENLFVAKEVSDGFTITYVQENLLVLRLAAFFTGVEFFIDNFLSGGFRLQFPSTRVRWSFSSVIRIDETLNNVKGSVYLALLVWIVSLLLGPLLYSPLFTAAGVQIFQPQVLERFFMFLDIKFMFRLLLWVYVPRLTLRLYLQLVNSFFTEIINFPIESPPNNSKCLTLSEGMKCDNAYLKCQAFYEFKLKARLGHQTSWYFSILPTSSKVLADVNDNMISFLRGAVLPSNILQGGFQPDILNKLRRDFPPTTSPVSAETLPENLKTATMRDLTSHNNPVAPDGPTVYDLVKQMPKALWNDLRDACKGLVTMQNLNNLIFFGKFETKLQEKQIANYFSQGTLSFWALEGTLELICISVTHDPHGIVHQDLQSFFKTVVETHDILSVLDFYVINTLDREDVNRQILEEVKIVIGKLLSATVFVLAKLNASFSHCYRILNVDENCERRILEIITARDVR
ncbi:Nucleoporin NDC1 [Orchesella cincta]|uniref:Nucleoporin NDC1 n=1 Tax=Orchesella cincta TaxID=48709 RepID=A0A1D2MKF9_ORCCI|nr:Nucleoporin NDC1 [Orchesella cincta]